MGLSKASEYRHKNRRAICLDPLVLTRIDALAVYHQTPGGHRPKRAEMVGEMVAICEALMEEEKAERRRQKDLQARMESLSDSPAVDAIREASKSVIPGT